MCVCVCVCVCVQERLTDEGVWGREGMGGG